MSILYKIGRNVRFVLFRKNSTEFNSDNEPLKQATKVQVTLSQALASPFPVWKLFAKTALNGQSSVGGR